jgi:predicted transcriptional regulator
MTNQPQKPTDKELEILQVIWKNGPSTVRQINDVLAAKTGIGYTTTLKLMQIMFEKGSLSRSKSGKTHTYSAEVSKEYAQGQIVNKLMDTVFNGSAMNLVMQALGNKQSSKQELDEIRAYLDQLEGGLDE